MCRGSAKRRARLGRGSFSAGLADSHVLDDARQQVHLYATALDEQALLLLFENIDAPKLIAGIETALSPKKMLPEIHDRIANAACP
jgi:hypothetical protein